MANGVLIISDHKEGEIDTVTFELIQKGRELSDKLEAQLMVLVLGTGIEGPVTELSGKGADVVYAADDSRLDPYIPEVHTQVICDVIAKVEPAVVLFGHTYRGIEMAPAIATRLNVAYASNCLDCELRDGLHEIPIESRSGDEVKFISGLGDNNELTRILCGLSETPAANYAFDVTPARLVSGIITERGIAAANEESLLQLFPEYV